MGETFQKLQDGLRHSGDFLKESWQELNKVHWPTRKEIYAATSVVLVLVLLMAFFLALVDFALTRAIQLILS